MQVQPGYAADWLANETGGSYIAFGAGSRLLKANSSDLYPAAPPAPLPNASFALTFAYPVENVAVGDQLVVSFLLLHMNRCSIKLLCVMSALASACWLPVRSIWTWQWPPRALPNTPCAPGLPLPQEDLPWATTSACLLKLAP